MASEQQLNRPDGSSVPDLSAAVSGSPDAPAAPAVAAAASVPPEQPWGPTTLQQLRCELQRFAEERDWQMFHTPRNLLLALTGEVGELAECFQWKGEVAAGLPGFPPGERQHVAEELADVLLYLLRLADQCHIDLAAAAHDKLRKNAAKYPAEQCRGSSAKYTRYATAAAATAAARGDHSAGSAGGGGGGEGGAAGGKR